MSSKTNPSYGVFDFSVTPEKVMCSLCPCGCGKLILYLRYPPPKGVSPDDYFRTVRCFPEGWDGSLWYTGQVKKHPWTKELWNATVGKWKKLYP